MFAIRMEYKGQERSTGQPLDEEMISQLAMEAEIRGMRIGELVAALILGIVKKDLFQLINDDACSGSAKGSPPRSRGPVRVASRKIRFADRWRGTAAPPRRRRKPHGERVPCIRQAKLDKNASSKQAGGHPRIPVAGRMQFGSGDPGS